MSNQKRMRENKRKIMGRKSILLEDFDLANLTSFKPDLLVNNNCEGQTDLFIIGLALAFNNIKDLLWLDHVFSKRPSGPSGAKTYG